ncbi:protein of unknown function [Flavobacteriaceae bacterium MAR_2010_188]|nr:protein of unknown function [Flavobacteriaceae bacterium MAR_2010_188]
MKANKSIVRIVGLLFLIQIVTYMIGNQFLTSPIINTPDFLTSIYENSDQLLIGTLLEFICAIAVVAISVLLYPILKNYSERIAIWYVGFRISEFTIIVFSKIKILSLIPLTQDYINTTMTENENLKTLGRMILIEHSIAVLMVMIAFGIGALMFYYLLFKSKLIPRFISVWGMIGVILVLTANVVELSGSSLGMLIYMPMGLNELFLGFWLLFKGLNLRLIDTQSSMQINT